MQHTIRLGLRSRAITNGPAEFQLLDIFVNCDWVDTRWQQYSTHLHTNNT